jgi:PAS domain S-box-containing protein
MKPCFEPLLEASGNPEMRLGSSESAGHALNRAPAWYAEGKYTRLWGIMHSDLAFAAFDGFERELLELLPAAVCICDAPSGVITRYNRRAGELWGAYPNPGEAVYCGAAKLYVDGEPVAHEKSPMARVLETGVALHGLEVEMERRDGSRIMAICDIEPLRDRTGRIVRAINIFQDITERKRTENLRARERQLLQQIAAGAPLTEILQNLALLVEGSTPGGAASILLLDPDGIHLWPAAAPKLPDEWIGAISPLRIGPNVGACGTAAYRKDIVVTHDIAKDPLWTDYRDLALAFGLRACWSTPIVASDGRLLGTFAIYYREPHSPDRQEIEAVRFITGRAPTRCGTSSAGFRPCSTSCRCRRCSSSPEAGAPPSPIAPPTKWPAAGFPPAARSTSTTPFITAPTPRAAGFRTTKCRPPASRAASGWKRSR